MKLNAKPSTIKKFCLITFSLFCATGLIDASSTDSAFASGQSGNISSKVAIVNGHLVPTPLVTRIVTPIGQSQQRTRRTKREAKKSKKGYTKVTKKSKCTQVTNPLQNGGIKVTKKCKHQYVFGNVPTANGSERTKAPVTLNPSAMPSAMPSDYPTVLPTSTPTFRPTSGPTVGPTSSPTTSPTAGPTPVPTQIEILKSSLPNESLAFKTSSSKTAVGALVGGVLGFVVLAAGAKTIETAWKKQARRTRQAGSDDDDASSMNNLYLKDQEQPSA